MCLAANVVLVQIYSLVFVFDKFSSLGFAAPNIAAACLVSANALMGSATVRGFSTSRGRSASSLLEKE